MEDHLNDVIKKKHWDNRASYSATQDDTEFLEFHTPVLSASNRVLYSHQINHNNHNKLIIIIIESSLEFENDKFKDI